MTDTPPAPDPVEGAVPSVLGAHAEFVVVVNADGELVDRDERFEAVVDADGDLDGTPLSDYLADPETVDRAVERALDAGTATVTVEPDGDDDRATERYELRLAADDDGPRRRVVGVGLERPASLPGDGSRVLDRTTDAVFAVDADWTVTYVNEHARPILGGAMGVDPEAELVGRGLWASIPDAVGTPFHEKYREAMTTQESVTFEAAYDPLDAVFEVRAYPSKSGLSVYFRDVTENRRRREELADRERLLREMYEVTSDTDRDFEEQVGALLELGQRVLAADYGVFSEIRGDEYVHRVARSPGGVVEAGSRVPLSATVCERTAAERRRVVISDVNVEAPAVRERIAHSGEDWLPAVNCYVGAPVVVAGDVYGTFCFYDGDAREGGFSEWETAVVDIMAQWIGYELTARRTSERLRRQNEQLDEFVSVVSHDLRNPLETLSGHLALAEETGDADHFEMCRTAIRRMDELIGDLLVLARAGQALGETESVDLSGLVRECWALVDAGAATLVVETERTVEADASRLRQVLENLVRNSVSHGGDGVTVTVGDTPEGFFVADDGPGVPAEDRERVFDTGFSTRGDGTGFGLNIVRQVADAHGWSVSLAESGDGGARFEFAV